MVYQPLYVIKSQILFKDMKYVINIFIRGLANFSRTVKWFHFFLSNKNT